MFGKILDHVIVQIGKTHFTNFVVLNYNIYNFPGFVKFYMRHGIQIGEVKSILAFIAVTAELDQVRQTN